MDNASTSVLAGGPSQSTRSSSSSYTHDGQHFTTPRCRAVNVHQSNVLVSPCGVGPGLVEPDYHSHSLWDDEASRTSLYRSLDGSPRLRVPPLLEAKRHGVVRRTETRAVGRVARKNFVLFKR